MIINTTCYGNNSKMGLMNAIDEFFTGSADEVEMMSSAAADQREQAQRLNDLQDEEETFGLQHQPSAASKRRQLSSSTVNRRDSCRSAKLFFFLIGGFAAMYLTYELGVGNGVKVGGGDINHEDSSNDYIETPSTSTSTSTFDEIDNSISFTKEILHDTRLAAKELIDLLHKYYGGETKAKAMLVESWQAHWSLEREALLSESSDSTGQGGNDNADDDAVNDSEEGRLLGKKNKGVKKANNIYNDPDNMTPDELSQHHHHKKERTTKLITTMARALLNPHQTKFTIGTIGSSVAAGHDNCHYDSYESQLERTLTPIFAAAKMDLQVQNAGEGGGCGDSHKNQVFCVTQNLSPDVDIVHYR